MYNKTPVDQFYFSYHTRSETEKSEIKKIYDTEVKKEINDKTADKISEAIGFDFEYDNVDGLGDAAVWQRWVTKSFVENSLIVLVGEYQFTVYVVLNKGNDYDLEKAILIASAIIDKACG